MLKIDRLKIPNGLLHTVGIVLQPIFLSISYNTPSWHAQPTHTYSVLL